MYERFLAVPLHFTIEFLGFLVVAGAAFLVGSRPSLIPGARSNRIAAVLGFAVLAVAQVIHGGLFPGGEFDTEQLLIALKALGMALILIGVAGASRPAAGGAVAAPVDSSGGLIAFAPAAAAAALAVMAFASSVRGPRDLRRLALGALLLAVAEGLIPFAVRGDSPLVDSYELASHLVRLAGYVAIASWLWTGVRSSIRTRFVASFVTLLVAVVLALSSALTGVISTNVERSELDRVARQLENVRNGVTRTGLAEIVQAARQAAEINLVQESIAGAPDVPDATSTAGAVLTSELFPADVVVLMNRRGRLLGWAGDGGHVTRRRQAKLTQADLVSILGSGPVQTVVNLARDRESADLVRVEDSIAAVGVSEVAHVDDRTRQVGVVALVDFLDHLTMERIEESSGTQASLVVGRRLVNTTIEADARARDLVPKAIKDELTFDDDGIVSGVQQVGTATFYSAITELRSTEFVVGYLVLSSPAALWVTEARADITRTLFLVALAVGSIVLLLAYYSGRRITRPIQMLTETAQRIREGDLQAQAHVEGEDEVGQLGETFNEMTSSLFRMTNDLREAAREEHQLRSRIETIIQSMADGLVAVDADGDILAFNREAEQLTGISAETAIGTPVEDVLDARDAQGRKVSLPIFEFAEASVGNVFIQHRGGDRIPVSVVSAALRTEEGETAGGVTVLRDMTREREVERMKSEFLSNISHELRTPLTPIKGYAEILDRKDVPPAKVKQFTRGILESTSRLERIVELLVDFAALEAGRLSPRSASVDLGSMVEALAKEWEERTPRHSVVAEVSGRLPKVVGDERLLRRSLEEILDNAVKFSPQGGTISLKVKGTRRQNGHERRKQTRSVEVTVADEGIGIAREDVSNIFSDFHQLDGSETRTYGGLGLGLAFVRRIVEAHDGSVRVESELDRGTRLTVSIPAARAAGGPAD